MRIIKTVAIVAIAAGVALTTSACDSTADKVADHISTVCDVDRDMSTDTVSVVIYDCNK